MKGTNIGFMSRVPTKEESVSCKNVVILSPEPWEPTIIKLGEVYSLSSVPLSIRIHDGYNAYIDSG